MFSRTHCPLFIGDYTLIEEERFYGVTFRFCIYKSGMMGRTYCCIIADNTESYDEEFDSWRESFHQWGMSESLQSLRLEAIRYAYSQYKPVEQMTDDEIEFRLHDVATRLFNAQIREKQKFARSEDTVDACLALEDAQKEAFALLTELGWNHVIVGKDFLLHTHSIADNYPSHTYIHRVKAIRPLIFED